MRNSWLHEDLKIFNGTQSLTVSSVKNSKMKVASVVLIPMNKLTHISTIYAVLDSLNRNDAGYMSGVIAHLQKPKHKEAITFFSPP